MSGASLSQPPPRLSVIDSTGSSPSKKDKKDKRAKLRAELETTKKKAEEAEHRVAAMTKEIADRDAAALQARQNAERDAAMKHLNDGRMTLQKLNQLPELRGFFFEEILLAEHRGTCPSKIRWGGGDSLHITPYRIPNSTAGFWAGFGGKSKLDSRVLYESREVTSLRLAGVVACLGGLRPKTNWSAEDFPRKWQIYVRTPDGEDTVWVVKSVTDWEKLLLIHGIKMPRGAVDSQ